MNDNFAKRFWLWSEIGRQLAILTCSKSAPVGCSVLERYAQDRKSAIRISVPFSSRTSRSYSWNLIIMPCRRLGAIASSFLRIASRDLYFDGICDPTLDIFLFQTGEFHHRRGRIFVKFHSCHSYRFSACRVEDAIFLGFIRLTFSDVFVPEIIFICDALVSELLQMSMHLLSVSFRSCRSRFLVCGF